MRLVKTLHEIEHAFGIALVEISCGFVGQQDRRPIHERTGNRYSLLLPAGKLTGGLPGPIIQSHFPQPVLG